MNTRVVPQALPRDGSDGLDELQRRWDAWLLAAVAALVGLGLVMVVSASTSSAARASGDPLYYLWRQGLFVLFGLAAAAVTLRIRVAVWARTGPSLLLVGMALLLLVLVPGIGREVNGSMRWIGLGPFNLQPSEPVKLFVILYVAGYLVRRAAEVRARLWGFVKPVALLSIIAGLLLLERIYGATVVLVALRCRLGLSGVPCWPRLANIPLALGNTLGSRLCVELRISLPRQV